MVSSYVVLFPYAGPPLVGEGKPLNIIDPFATGALDPQAFLAVDDWSMDVEQTLNIGSQSSGAGAGRITFNPFSITRKVDKVSPLLFLKAASGTPFEFVDLIQRRSGRSGAAAVFLAWRFRLVAVKTVSWSDDDDSPHETVTFEYGGLSIEYFPQKPDGSLDVGIETGWDRVRNVKL